MVREGILHEVALAKTCGEQGTRETIIVRSRGLGLVKRPGEANTRRHSLPQPTAAKPPNGREPFCNSSNSDLRVTGNAASASRVETDCGSMPSNRRANAGACAFACAIWEGRRVISSRSRSAGSRVSLLS
jgi:hypothetical protein